MTGMWQIGKGCIWQRNKLWQKGDSCILQTNCDRMERLHLTNKWTVTEWRGCIWQTTALWQNGEAVFDKQRKELWENGEVAFNKQRNCDRMERVVNEKLNRCSLPLTQIVVEDLDVLGQPDVAEVPAMQQYIPLRHKVQLPLFYLCVCVWDAHKA